MENKEQLEKFEQNQEMLNKHILNIEIALGLITTISFFIIFGLSVFLIYKLNIYLLPAIMIVLSIIIFFVGATICLYIEQKTGFYECEHCHNKYVPTFNQTFWAPHIWRTRYLKCPKCNKRSWNKKVLK